MYVSGAVAKRQSIYSPGGTQCQPMPMIVGGWAHYQLEDCTQAIQSGGKEDLARGMKKGHLDDVNWATSTDSYT